MTRKTAFFEGWSCFKFNNLGLALCIVLKFYISVTKELKVKVEVTKFSGLIPTFVEVTGEKLVGAGRAGRGVNKLIFRFNVDILFLLKLF